MLHEAGETLHSRYLVQEIVGQGGMGAVYRAEDIDTGETVAVKQLRPDSTSGFDNADLMARFQGEWQLLRSLDHARIPRMLDSFLVDGNGYYVMQFIEGPSLDQLLRKFKTRGRRFPEEALMEYAIKTLDVLAYLHERPRPLLHRDIKPQNLIVRPSDQELFLVDFGLAREGGSHTTRTLVGTLGYAPLEQIKGHPEVRSDLYALGASMWHMLVGEQPQPFDIPPLRSARNDIHPLLGEVVDRACQDNPQRRYASARKMQAALVSALSALTGDRSADGHCDGENEDDIIIHERPSLSAARFLFLAGVASVTAVVLMLGVKRYGHWPGEPAASATPMATFSTTPDSQPASLGLPTMPSDTPVLHPLADRAPRVSTPPAGSSLPLPTGWTLRGTAGRVAGGNLEAAPGESSAAVAFAPRARLGRLRMGLSRNFGPSNFQCGVFLGHQLVVGITLQLQRGSYLAYLSGPGSANSPPFEVPWKSAYTQTLELTHTAQGWQLLDVASGQTSQLAGNESDYDNLQLIVPAAQERQVVNLFELLVTPE